ncbi:uncharacterized protein LOC132720295, partial [Ruditapes philippinarum]|uniref:uncharacterized protein LOC132720295 n=1 Tax=Ruditapes philippinarum TaxID=129788 RepID=UPI00295ADB41
IRVYTFSLSTSFCRVEKAPCKSPIQTPDHVADFNVTNFQSQPRHKTVPDKQLYSYTRWSRSQRPDAKKSDSVEQKPKLLARTNTTSWNETRYEQQNVRESTNTVSARDRNIDPSEYNPIVAEGNIPATKFRLAKKVNTGQKVAMTIKKHNVNLPSLTKNSKSQTMADYGGKVSRDRPAKVLYP